MFFFQHIWCMGPCLRTWKINCAFFRACCTIFLVACCGPCAEVCGLYFSKIKVRYQRLPDREEEDKDILMVWWLPKKILFASKIVYFMCANLNWKKCNHLFAIFWFKISVILLLYKKWKKSHIFSLFYNILSTEKLFS